MVCLSLLLASACLTIMMKAASVDVATRVWLCCCASSLKMNLPARILFVGLRHSVFSDTGWFQPQLRSTRSRSFDAQKVPLGDQQVRTGSDLLAS